MTTPEVPSFQVRAELEDLLERDLLGPWDGPEEELPPKTSPASSRFPLSRSCMVVSSLLWGSIAGAQALSTSGSSGTVAERRTLTASRAP